MPKLLLKGALDPPVAQWADGDQWEVNMLTTAEARAFQAADDALDDDFKDEF